MTRAFSSLDLLYLYKPSDQGFMWLTIISYLTRQGEHRVLINTMLCLVEAKTYWLCVLGDFKSGMDSILTSFPHTTKVIKTKAKPIIDNQGNIFFLFETFLSIALGSSCLFSSKNWKQLHYQPTLSWCHKQDYEAMKLYLRDSNFAVVLHVLHRESFPWTKTTENNFGWCDNIKILRSWSWCSAWLSWRLD